MQASVDQGGTTAGLDDTRLALLGSAGGETMSHWTEYGVRHVPPMSARTRVTEMAPPLVPFVDERVAKLDDPFLGVTIDGVVRQGLYALTPTGVSLQPLVEVASAFLGALTSEQRGRAHQPLDSQDWRTWINVHMTTGPSTTGCTTPWC